MGGRPWFAEDGGKKFVETLFRYYPGNVNVAFCIFAQPESDWEETRSVNTETFIKHGGNRRIVCKTMTAENIAEISAWADVIYLPGGSPSVLRERLNVCGDLATLWDDKVIAGSSAGADIFCQGFIYLQDKTCGEGLGWIPAACIPHWRSDFEGYTQKDWDTAEQTVLARFPDLPILCIPETQFVEYTVR